MNSHRGILITLVSCAAVLACSASPLCGQTVYACVWGDPHYVVGSSTLRSGLFRSTDAGRTWEHLGPENLKTFSMDATQRGRILFIAAGNGVHRSLDSGRTWRIVTDWRMTEVLDVAIDQEHPQWILAATAFGFWRSSDGGNTWEKPKGPLEQRYVRVVGYVGDRLIAIADGPSTTAPVDQFASTDHGTTWMSTGSQRSAITHLDSSTVALSVIRVGGETLAGTWGSGVKRRQGPEWVPSGLEGAQVWRLRMTGF